MEQHPVPQNILDVEFKLFGAFSLRQFMRIVFGGLGALFFFILPLPSYFKLPLMGISLLVGVGLAIVPNLGIWISGYLKSLFISPRYVWEKNSVAPEILTKNFKKSTENIQNVSKAKKKKNDLSEISLNKLLDQAESQSRSIPTSKPSTQSRRDPLEPGDANIDRLLEQIFDKKASNVAKQQVANTRPVQQQVPAATQQVSKTRQKTSNDYVAQIKSLKNELRSIVKDQNYKQKEVEILEKIADLQRELNFSPNNSSQPKSITQVQEAPKKNMVDQRGNTALVEGSSVFGVVVDSADNPVSNAEVTFKNQDNSLNFSSQTSEDGRFATAEKLPQSTYDVSINHPNFRFDSYKIRVGNEKLPAYKLRAK